MEQRISVITLGANNVDAMKTFYREILGWSPVAENRDIVFYKLNGFLFSICNREMLADFIGINHLGQGFRSMTIGYNVSTRDEVLALYDSLKGKVRILKTPTEPPFGGLFFYFEDIEGNILEVAYNPFIVMDDDNSAVGHKAIDHL